MPTFTAPKRNTMFTSVREKRAEFVVGGLGPLLTESGLEITTEAGEVIVVEGELYSEIFTAPKRTTRFTASRE